MVAAGANHGDGNQLGWDVLQQRTWDKLDFLRNVCSITDRA
jgi:hypothetical protein